MGRFWIFLTIPALVCVESARDASAEPWTPRRDIRLRDSGALWAVRLDSTAGSTAGSRRGTQGKTGFKRGMVIGSIAGAGTFVLFGLVGQELCEGDGCEDISAPGWIGVAALGAASGALVGGVIGGLFGSMIPADSPAGPRETRPETGAPAVDRRAIASFTIQPGYGQVTERGDDESGFTLRATLLAQLTPWLGVGPEYMHGNFAGGMNSVSGAVFAGSMERRWSPYVVGDLGWYGWKEGAAFSTGDRETDASVLGAGIGAGFAWSPGSGRVRLGAEGRYHWTPQNIEGPEAYRFYDLGATLRVQW